MRRCLPRGKHAINGRSFPRFSSGLSFFQFVIIPVSLMATLIHITQDNNSYHLLYTYYEPPPTPRIEVFALYIYLSPQEHLISISSTTVLSKLLPVSISSQMCPKCSFLPQHKQYHSCLGLIRCPPNWTPQFQTVFRPLVSLSQKQMPEKLSFCHFSKMAEARIMVIKLKIFRGSQWPCGHHSKPSTLFRAKLFSHGSPTSFPSFLCNPTFTHTLTHPNTQPLALITRLFHPGLDSLLPQVLTEYLLCPHAVVGLPPSPMHLQHARFSLPLNDEPGLTRKCFTFTAISSAPFILVCNNYLQAWKLCQHLCAQIKAQGLRWGEGIWH